MLSLIGPRSAISFCKIPFYRNPISSARHITKKYSNNTTNRVAIKHFQAMLEKVMGNLNQINYPKIDFKAHQVDISRFTPEALHNLAVQHSEQGDPEHQKIGVALLFEAAKQKSPDALNDLGVLIAHEEPVLNFKCDPLTGVDFLEMAAKFEHPEAYLNLAFLYLKGIAVPQNIPKALEYYKDAHNIGHKDAQKFINFINKAIQNVPESEQVEALNLAMEKEEKAIEDKENSEYEKNVEALEKIYSMEDKADAAYEAALCQYYGKFGVKMDIEIGKDLLLDAAGMKSSKAQHRLGLFYRSGAKGFELNVPCGTALVITAAHNEERPNASANYDVGMFYRTGSGVEKNLDEALKYFKRAKVFGSPHAERAIKFTKEAMGLRPEKK